MSRMPRVNKTTAIIAGATSALAAFGAMVAFTPAASAASATVVLSEVYRVLQEVPGVGSVDIDRLQFKDQTPAFLASRGATADPVQRSLRIFAARPDPASPAVLPAELAVVEAPATDIELTTAGGLPE